MNVPFLKVPILFGLPSYIVWLWSSTVLQSHDISGRRKHNTTSAKLLQLIILPSLHIACCTSQLSSPQTVVHMM